MRQPSITFPKSHQTLKCVSADGGAEYRQQPTVESDIK